jgi:hypothetical protein
MKGSYETGDRLGCQAAHTKVETIKKWAVKTFKIPHVNHSTSLSQNSGGRKV